MDEQGYADLHLHTNRSDGYYSPKALIDKVLQFGLRAIAIVDHDEIGGIEEAMPYGRANGLEVISGVELSVSFRNLDLHVLGYCFNHNDPRLVEYLELFKAERLKRAEKIVQNLANLGMPISLKSVLQKAGQGSVGRPHIANVLMEDGHVGTFQEAFNKFLAKGKPANIDKYKIDVHEAFDLIKSAGGVCSIAHPGLELSNEALLTLIKAGADAVEVYHPKHTEDKSRQLKQIVESHGVLITGGSDFHGGEKGEDALGKYKVPYKDVLKIKAFASHNQA